MEISSDYLCNRLGYKFLSWKCLVAALTLAWGIHSTTFCDWLKKPRRPIKQSASELTPMRTRQSFCISDLLLFLFSFLFWVLYNHKMFVAIFFLVVIKSASTTWQLHRTGLQGEYLLVDICINIYYLYFTQNQMIPYRVLADDLP